MIASFFHTFWNTIFPLQRLHNGCWNKQKIPCSLVDAALKCLQHARLEDSRWSEVSKNIDLYRLCCIWNLPFPPERLQIKNGSTAATNTSVEITAIAAIWAVPISLSRFSPTSSAFELFPWPGATVIFEIQRLKPPHRAFVNFKIVRLSYLCSLWPPLGCSPAPCCFLWHVCWPDWPGNLHYRSIWHRWCAKGQSYFLGAPQRRLPCCPVWTQQPFSAVLHFDELQYDCYSVCWRNEER